MNFYRLRKDKLRHCEIGDYISYGIDAFDAFPAVPVHSIRDISTEKESVELLIFLCNHLNLDIIHLGDVIA